MYVLKRDGRKENVHFDKITSRIAKLCYGLDPVHVVRKIKFVYNNNNSKITNPLYELRMQQQFLRKLFQDCILV